MAIDPRSSAFAAVTAAKEAIARARQARPSAELQQAMELAEALERELGGRPKQNSAYTTLKALRQHAPRLGPQATAAIDALAAANDAVTYLHLDSDPTTATMKAIDAAIRSGVDRHDIENAVRTARFR